MKRCAVLFVNPARQDSVMMTDKEAAAQAGCTAFLEKPVMPDDVIDIVQRLITRAGT